MNSCSVADPGCLSWIPDPNFFHPGFTVKKIPGFRTWIHIRIKEFRHFKQKIVTKLSEI
jgi:hypothetical protein